MHDSKKCPNCGACKECGAAPVKMIPYPVPTPYPVYPQPVNPWPYQPYRYPTWTVSGAGTSGYGGYQQSISGSITAQTAAVASQIGRVH